MIRSVKSGWLSFAKIGTLIIAGGLATYTVHLRHQLDVAGERYRQLQTDSESTERTLTHSLTRAESRRDLLQRKVAALTKEVADAHAAAGEHNIQAPCLPCERDPSWQDSLEPGFGPDDNGSSTGGHTP